MISNMNLKNNEEYIKQMRHAWRQYTVGQWPIIPYDEVITINDVYEGEIEFDQSFMMTKAEFGNVTVTSGSDPEIK